MSEITLNLGAGEKIMANATNVDARPLPGIDLVADVSKLPLPDNHADKIIASDIVEHFQRSRTVDVLKEWHRVLKPGGTCIVKTPNLRTICERYIAGEIPAEEASRLLYGGQEYPGNFHHAGFDVGLFSALATQAGFAVLRIVEHPDPPDENNMILRLVKT